MIERLDQIFVLLKHWLVGYLPADGRAAAGVMLSVVAIVAAVSRAVCVDHGAGAQGPGTHSEPAWSEPRGAVRDSAADGRRHQVADQRRYCSDERGCGGALSGADGAGGGGLHGICGAAHGPQHGAGGYGRRPAVLFRHGCFDGAVCVSWRDGRAATSIRCWARCARWHR